jgi:hypothetical protein
VLWETLGEELGGLLLYRETMIPNTDYPEKAVSMSDLIARLRLAPQRLSAALEGLSADECAASFNPDEWSTRECVIHVAKVSLGWTDIFYEAIADAYPTPRAANPHWKEALEEETGESMQSGLEVYRRHNEAVASFLAAMPAEDFDRPFKVVAFLSEPFQINESINWGLVLHCDYHLASIHNQRRMIGKPLDWMAVYLERFPRPEPPLAMPG